MSGKNLSISGSLVIEERVFDQLGLTYVCEILDGQIIRSNLSTNLGSSDCLKPAVGSGRFDSGFAQSLTLLSPASSQPRIVTLFLTDDITCSSTAKRLSNEFTVNSKCSLNVTEQNVFCLVFHFNDLHLTFLFCFSTFAVVISSTGEFVTEMCGVGGHEMCGVVVYVSLNIFIG